MYCGLDNITNKHPIDERGGIPHHVMNHVPWLEEYFIHRFSQEANAAILDIHSRGKVPIVVGGTHYYLQNLLFRHKTIAESADSPGKVRDLTTEETDLLDGPVKNLFEAVKEIDPVIAGKFHPQDQRKLRRALEIFYTTGQKPLEIYREQKLDEFEDTSLRFNTTVFWLYAKHEILHDRLDKRVDQMMLHGAILEIRAMHQEYQRMTPPPDCTRGIWQVIGYKEFLPWLLEEQSGQSPKLDILFKEGVERMKIRTRQYAKSQVKWIRKILALELQKESQHNFKYGGKIYLLNATDLTEWTRNVSEKGIDIARDFLEKGPRSVRQAQCDEETIHVYPTHDYVDNLRSNKKAGAESGWRHYECDVCLNKDGKSFVAVGEDRWKVHIEGRKHRKQLLYIDKKRKHEEFMQLKAKKDSSGMVAGRCVHSSSG